MAYTDIYIQDYDHGRCEIYMIHIFCCSVYFEKTMDQLLTSSVRRLQTFCLKDSRSACSFVNVKMIRLVMKSYRSGRLMEHCCSHLGRMETLHWRAANLLTKGRRTEAELQIFINSAIPTIMYINLDSANNYLICTT